MARSRRASSILETTRQRRAGLTQIKPPVDLGPGITTTEYEAAETSFTEKLDLYNQHLAALDDEQNAIDTAETSLSEWNRRILAAVGARYGTDSSEYELVGGTRTSERKRKSRKTADTPPATK